MSSRSNSLAPGAKPQPKLLVHCPPSATSSDNALEILARNQIMAISTLRPDGWPQTTFVGYANEGFTLYFVVFRESQKFLNIKRDDRVSVAIGEEPASLQVAKAFYAGAFAAEVIDAKERQLAWKRLGRRHPNLLGRDIPDSSVTAIMRAECRHVSVVDYSLGLGHIEAFTISAGTLDC